MTAENQPAASGLPPQSDKDDFNAHESLVDGLVVVSVSGSVDMLTAPGLAESLDSALAKKTERPDRRPIQSRVSRLSRDQRPDENPR